MDPRTTVLGSAAQRFCETAPSAGIGIRDGRADFQRRGSAVEVRRDTACSASMLA